MELKLSNVERTLIREALINTIINADNFGEIEKEYLQGIYDRIKEYEEKHINA